MHYIVTHIDPYLKEPTQDLEDKIFDAMGIWSAKNSEELWTKVEKFMYPYTIKSFEYEKIKPHYLTAFM